jgi:dienelactone hydrolase
MAVALVGCSDSELDDEAVSSPSMTSSASKPKLQPGRGYATFTFPAADGQRRSGRLYGDGSAAVVLSHMSGDGPKNWHSFARRLADEGFQVLAYQERPEFEAVWQDVLGAASYLRDAGAEKVVVAGASIGAMASLRAAEEPGAELDGVIWLAGLLSYNGYDFQQSDVAEVACPTLVIAGADDLYGAAPDARRLHEWLTAPKQLLVLDSAQHGTDIIDDGGPTARRLTDSMLRFVRRVAREPTQQC